MTDRTGQRLDNYRMLLLLGQGNFGDVYLAEHVHQHTRVALKIFNVRFDEEMLENFLNEARTLFLLKHASIVPLLDFGLDKEPDPQKKTPFLVMEYAPNGTLRQRHRSRDRVGLDRVVSYVQQMASALQYAHDQRLIHRDVKPQNMLIGSQGQVLLSDFGVAATAHTEHSLTVQGMMGTVPYMSPEQIQGKVSTATDQYALGVCTYEWLCGTRPFTGSTWEVITQHISALPDPLRSHVSEIPPEVEAVVLQALAKNPQERFASIANFATALEQASEKTVFYPTVLMTDEQRDNNFYQAPTIFNPESDYSPTVLKTPAQETQTEPSGANAPLIPPTVQPGDSFGTVTDHGRLAPQELQNTPSQGLRFPLPFEPPQSSPSQGLSFPLPPSSQSSPSQGLPLPLPPSSQSSPSQGLPFPLSPSSQSSPSQGLPFPFPPSSQSSPSQGLPLPSSQVSSNRVVPSPITPIIEPFISSPITPVLQNLTSPPQQPSHPPKSRWSLQLDSLYKNWDRLLVGVLLLVLVALLGNLLIPISISNYQKSVSLAATRTAQAQGTADAHARQTQIAQIAPIDPTYKQWVDSSGIMFGFDVAHTRWNQLEKKISVGNVTNLHQRWSYMTGGAIESSLTATDRTVYATSDDGQLYAFDASCQGNCRPLWSYTIGNVMRSSPAVANGIVYIGSNNHMFYAFDELCRVNCQPLWSYKTGGGIDSSPAVANGKVYIGSWDNRIYAFDATCLASCQPLWSYKTGDGIFSSPAIADGKVYVGSVDGRLYAFDANCQSDCQPLWSYKTGNRIDSSPAIAHGKVYVGSTDGKFYAFDEGCQKGCLPLWSYTTGGSIVSSPAIDKNKVYIGSNDNHLYAFDANCRKHCQPLWSFATGSLILSSPTVANGVVYIGSEDHLLYAFDASCPSDCQPLWSFATGGITYSSPTVADGVVYIGSQDHILYAFGL
jgi:serine/threonine protein kinase/outer membrane protein assembly factor BamB